MRHFLFAFILSVSAVGIAAQTADRQRTISFDLKSTSAVAAGSIAAPAAASAEERRAFDLINAERVKAGLPMLTWNDSAAAMARGHSENMSRFNFFSHRDTDGFTVAERAGKFGVADWQAIAENIAYIKGFDDPAKNAVESWLGSPSHKRNMLAADWAGTAIGVSISKDGKYYFTQVFLR